MTVDQHGEHSRSTDIASVFEHGLGGDRKSNEVRHRL
jgi:hypothetical protein